MAGEHPAVGVEVEGDPGSEVEQGAGRVRGESHDE
jgi:hypothetical protein